MTFSLERKITFGFGLSLAAILVIAVTACWSAVRLGGMFGWVDHTHRGIDTVDSFVGAAQAIQIEAQRFVITADPLCLERWTHAVERARTTLQEIRASFSTGGFHAQQLDEMETLLGQEISLTAHWHELRQKSGLEVAATEVGRGAVRNVVDRLTALSVAMKAQENARLAEHTAATRSAVRTSGVLIFVTTIAALLVGAAAFFQVRRDFVRLKATERALQKSSDRVRDLYDNSPCGYHSLSREGVFMDVNATELKWLGYTREELIGKKFSEVITPASLAAFQRQFPAFVREGSVVNLEFEMVRKDGAVISTLLNSTAIRDEAGTFIASRSTVYDITDRKNAQDERDRFFNLTRDLLCIADFDGYFRRLNPAWEKTLGFTNDELMAEPLRAWVHPDDHARNAAEAARQFQGGETTNFENRYRCRDGSYRWLRWSAVPLPSERLIFASARDITEEKQLAEAHIEFHALFDSLPGLYLVMKPDLSIVAASDAFLVATRTKREAMMGKNVFDIFPDNPGANSVENLTASFRRVLQTAAADTMPILRYDIPHEDGTFEERYWTPINAPVFGRDRQVRYIIHRVEDVTEFVQQKRAMSGGLNGELHAKMERMESEVYQTSQQAELANERLRAANQELESFSYSVSHDLRAPLRHIHGFAGLLQRSGANLDDKGRHYLQVISDAARQMGRLIDDLLAFSRISRSHLTVGEVDHNALIAESVRDGRYDGAEARAINWRIETLPAAQGDSAMLRQVWVNLIDNAVKYSSKSGHPQITIGSKPAPHSSEQVYFVRDNGVGFDMQYAGKLFGVFQRLHSSAEFEGTGIGLANVQRIISRHGGRVWAEGAVGAGATFYFSLPSLVPTSAATTSPAHSV